MLAAIPKSSNPVAAKPCIELSNCAFCLLWTQLLIMRINVAFICEKMYSPKKSLISKTGINPYHGVECT